MTTEERLRSLLEAATPGPWESDGTWLTGASKVEPGARTIVAVNDAEDADWEADRELAAAGITALPKLLAVVAAARAIHDELGYSGTGRIMLMEPDPELDAGDQDPPQRFVIRLRAALAALDEP